MLKLKQGMAAITLVVTLGLLMPSVFGGPASADVENSRDNNHNLADPYYFDCDLNGNGDYETRYDLASTFSAEGRHVQGSNLVLMVRYRYDIKDDHYEVVQDPTETAVDFDDPDTYWFDSPGSALPNGGNPKGWKTVLCRNEGRDLYAPNREDVEEVNPEFGLSFVQTDECLDDPDEDNSNCVVYEETWTNYWAVTLSQVGKRAAADSADDAPSAERDQPTKKNGKHRGKGKRGR